MTFMPNDTDFVDDRSNKKKCGHCQQWEKYSEFYKNATTKDGYHCWCKQCLRKYRESVVQKNSEESQSANSKNYIKTKRCGHCNQVKPVSEFNKQKSTINGYYCWCKQCVKKRKETLPQRSVEEILADPESYTKTKMCNQCKQVKTLSEFHVHKGVKDGHRCICKQCRSENWAINRDKHSKEKHARYLRDRSKILATSKKRYEEKKEEIIPKVKEYYKENREHILTQKKEYRSLECVKERDRARHKAYNILYTPRRKELAIMNKDHINELRRKYRKTTKGKLQDRRKYSRRKRLGFKPLNTMFPNSDYHHMYLNINGKINRSIGIYIPHELHRSVFHNPKTGQGMREINKLALIWLSEQSII